MSDQAKATGGRCYTSRDAVPERGRIPYPIRPLGGEDRGRALIGQFGLRLAPGTPDE